MDVSGYDCADATGDYPGFIRPDGCEKAFAWSDVDVSTLDAACGREAPSDCPSAREPSYCEAFE